jgi:hypothetical protein
VRQFALSLATLAACSGLGLVGAYRFYTPDRSPPFQFWIGYFEEAATAPTLVLDRGGYHDVFPGVQFGDDGALNLPPGTVAAVALGGNQSYVVTTDSRELAPDCVLGAGDRPDRGVTDEPFRTPASGSESMPATRLTGGRTLAVVDGRLALTPWDPGAPLTRDRLRLAALRSLCAEADGTCRLVVREDGSRMSLVLGRCRVDEDGGAAAGESRVMAVLAGTEWTILESSTSKGNSGLVDGERLATAFRVIVVTSLVSIAGFGRPVALTMFVFLVLASWYFAPVYVAATLCLGALIGLVIAIARAARWLLRRSSARIRYGTIGASALAVALLVWQHSGPTGVVERLRADRASNTAWSPRCVLVGYSTAADSALRTRAHGTAARLRDACVTCEHRVAHYAAGGETFDMIRDVACAADAPLRPGTQMIFLGGTNDDLVFALFRRPLGYLRAVLDALRPNSHGTTRVMTDLVDFAGRASLAEFPAQETLLREAMECLSARGATLLYLQDFMVIDVTRGRSPARAEMVRRRRALVESFGGVFVDLLETHGDRVSVAWFNDYIHLSSVGHQRVGETACDRLTPLRPSPSRSSS